MSDRRVILPDFVTRRWNAQEAERILAKPEREFLPAKKAKRIVTPNEAHKLKLKAKRRRQNKVARIARRRNRRAA
jgi:hypothetical protein